MKTNLDHYILANADNLGVTLALRAIIADARRALSELQLWERCAHIFWLLGPFILLIERTPADAWVTLLGLTFAVRAIITREGDWLRHFWVRAGFFFWFWCILAGAISDFPAYSV